MVQWRKVWPFQVNLSPWVNPPCRSPLKTHCLHWHTFYIIWRGCERVKIPFRNSWLGPSPDNLSLSSCLVWTRLSEEKTVPAAASCQWEHGPGRQWHAPHRPHPVHRPHAGHRLPSQPAHCTPPLHSFHTTPLPWQVSLIPLPFILSTALLPCTHFFTLENECNVILFNRIPLGVPILPHFAIKVCIIFSTQKPLNPKVVCFVNATKQQFEKKFQKCQVYVNEKTRSNIFSRLLFC